MGASQSVNTTLSTHLSKLHPHFHHAQNTCTGRTKTTHILDANYVCSRGSLRTNDDAMPVVGEAFPPLEEPPPLAAASHRSPCIFPSCVDALGRRRGARGGGKRKCRVVVVGKLNRVRRGRTLMHSSCTLRKGVAALINSRYWLRWTRRNTTQGAQDWF